MTTTATLCGAWKSPSASGDRVCYIAATGCGYSVREAHELKADASSRIGMFSGDDSRIVLRAPWGKNKTMREWFGTVDQSGTRIVWEGRRGTSFWHKIG
jgi:hypothetical protein